MIPSISYRQKYRLPVCKPQKVKTTITRIHKTKFFRKIFFLTYVSIFHYLLIYVHIFRTKFALYYLNVLYYMRVKKILSVNFASLFQM